MKFGIINPKHNHAWEADLEKFDDALDVAGLKPGSVDHGLIRKGVGIVVYEYGLFTPPARQSYFAIGERLFGGSAILYGINENGLTVDLGQDELIDIRWFKSTREVEAAIEKGEINQPSIKVDGEVVWVWPQPTPKFLMKENSK